MEVSPPIWHYADALQQQHGPLTAEQLRARFERGELTAATLVWRSGTAQWRRLADCREELGISPLATGVTLPNYEEAVPAVIGGDEVVYAGLWRRVAASIIDSFVTAAVTYILTIPLMLMFGLSVGMLAERAHSASSGVSVLFITLIYGIILLLPAIYFGWMQATAWQASLGKLAVGIKVVRSDGQRIGFWRGFLRYLVYKLLSVLTCGIGVIVAGLMAGLTQRKQAPHDFFCDTLVVDRWAWTQQSQLQQRGLDTVTIVVLILYGVIMLVAVIAVLALLFVAGSIPNPASANLFSWI